MLLILCGKTASGKNTYRETLMQRNPFWHRAVSHTTRPMRDGEKNHLQYHFVENIPFITMAIQNFFIETTDYRLSDYTDDKWYYGLSKSEVHGNKVSLAILNQDGVKNAVKYLRKDKRTIIVRPGLVLGEGGIFSRISNFVNKSPIVPLPDGGKGCVSVITIERLCNEIIKLCKEY